MKIDVQCHVFPKKYADLFVENSIYPKAVRSDGRYIFDFNGYQTLVMSDKEYDPQTILESMDRAGIDFSLISCNIPDPGLLPEKYVPLAAKIANDEVADIVSRHPDRFSGIAFLPWNMPEEALQELDRVIKMGFKSVMLFSHNGGVQVDDPSLEDLYSHLEELQVPVTLHPSIPLWSDSIGVYSMVANVSFVIDTSFAVIRMVRSGILEKHPNLKLVMPHAGGVLPYLDGRLQYVPPGARSLQMQNKQQTVPEYLKKGNIWLDLANPSSDVLSYCNHYMSGQRLMLGSDYPFVEQDYISNMVASVFSGENLEAVLWKNANEVYRLGKS